jgi:tRNA A-37 threonylcarbamoyl transferase component Bud32
MMSTTTAHPKLKTDTLLPQRDLLLDAREVARRLSPQLGTSAPLAIDSCERIRAKYRVGDSLRVLYRVRVGGLDHTVAARAFGAGRSVGAYQRALRAAVTGSSLLRPVTHDAELATVFWTFPNDRRIGGLQALDNIPAELAQLFAPAWTRSQLVAYAPEKCATVQCLDDRSKVRAYAKVYAGDEGQRIFEVYRALRQSLSSGANGLQLPCAFAYSETHHLLLLEAIEGRRISDLDGDELIRGYHRLGLALAALHNLPVPDGLPIFKRLDIGRINRAARIVGQARPDVLCEALSLARKLALRWEPSSHVPVCLHGDVHPKNGILRGDRLTLIDLDQAAAGDAAADLGSLLASLSYNHLAGLFSRTRARRLGEVFLDGYAGLRKLPEQPQLDWHTAAALLAERALRAINRIRPEGLRCLRELLIEAKDILRTGGRR